MHYAQGFNVTIELNMLQQSTLLEYLEIQNYIKLYFALGWNHMNSYKG